MDLFSPDPTANVLPADGAVYYHGPVMDAASSTRYYENLLATVPWQSDEVVLFGRRIVTARKVAWYGNAGCRYAYSGTVKTAIAWTPELLELKALVEEKTALRFNSCLLNLYASGHEGMGWHSDDEKSLGPAPTIASLSFGAERKFAFRHKRSGITRSLVLEDASLLVMAPPTQEHWQHSLPKTRKVGSPRVNLTFRSIRLPGQ
ncbi:alpha-ketoglutarate-dependent dioxygenase AlkB [Ruficoccus amylovorans]|uniref:Alpha-ketoglutarate-dependent dioxygenase AlkB n=1 Tax=Ruficoccus amylovorans TaxID=1804625 RepID=A0A842HFW4_9BACT|nr:alpha-ketoglutarate-dependent dioxygenase AlkB [Ruficoccus amylovorans]MBC2594467.1 alpha-ketoglutarate-dependent dioxygenase AlkB [Ruficoccus amylovorans]